MSEPRRLRDEAASTVELMLLEAGASYRSSPDARVKTLAALGLAGSAAVSAGVGAAASSLATKLGWGKVLLVSSLGAGVIAPMGVVAWNQFHTAPRVEISASIAPAAAPVRPAVQKVSPAPEPVPDVAPAVTPPAKPEARGTSQGALVAELGALDAARTQLASGNASGALAKLDDYARTYPHGRLVLEAEVLRIDALAKSGQKDTARKRAATFLKRHPNSVLASRVRGYLN